jgi:hypothetical protein
MTIRPERPGDAARVRHVNELAFGRRPAEADLVERLRQACTDSLSLVAEDDAVVGHILAHPIAEKRIVVVAAVRSRAIRSSSVRPGSISTSKSMSLFGRASPRTIDPNTRTLRAPWCVASSRIVRRCACSVSNVISP